jgi:hypothetical protein
MRTVLLADPGCLSRVQIFFPSQITDAEYRIPDATTTKNSRETFWPYILLQP